jgi:hypothetical protein
MLNEVVSIVDGMWVCDPQKIVTAGLMSHAIADRAGPDEISKILNATHMADGPWNYSVQNGQRLDTRQLPNVTANFTEIGSEFYLNQFLELDGKILLWLPDFSEFSVLVFQPELYAALSGVLAVFGDDLQDWIASGIWTDNERRFIIGGKESYTILTVA